MLALSSPQITALASGAIVRRGMIRFDLGSGTYAFWDGNEAITYNSVTYNAGGQLIDISAADQGVGMASSSVTVKLYASPDIPSSILSTIFAEQYRRRAVTVSEALIDADTRALIGAPVVKWRGYIHAVEMKEDGDKIWIEGRLESRSLDNTKRGYAMSNGAHHADVDATDLFFEHVATAGSVPVYFGQKKAKAKDANSGSPAGGGRAMR